MIRSVVYKDDSFLVRFQLKNELNESLKQGQLIDNVNEDLFEIVVKGLYIDSGYKWYSADPSEVYYWHEVLRRKDTTPIGYYRFQQPLYKYKLASDANTDPYRGVYGEPPEIIFTIKPVIFLDYLDKTRPFAEDFIEKIKEVFRVISKLENPSHFYREITNSKLFALVNQHNIWLRSYFGGICIGPPKLTLPIQNYETISTDSDIVAKITNFCFNMNNEILVAKAGEELRYYNIRKINNGEGDSEIYPLIKTNGKAFALIMPFGTGPMVILAENSYFQREQIYNLLANIFGIFNSADAKLDYYDLSQGTDKITTFTLPDTLLLIWIGDTPGTIRYRTKSDGSIAFTETNFEQTLTLVNYSNSPKVIDIVRVFVGSVDGNLIQIYEQSGLNKPIGILSAESFNLNFDLSKVGSTVVSGEVVGTGDGSTKEFYLANKPVKEGSEKIYVNEVEQTRDQDYTIDYETGKITFATAPASGAEITADYIYYKRFRISFLDPDGKELAFIDRWATFEF
jgi:hypothetical protein